MKLIDIIDNYHIELYELNRSICTRSICGAILFKGNANLLKKSKHLQREVFKIFEYPKSGTTIVIIY